LNRVVGRLPVSELVGLVVLIALGLLVGLADSLFWWLTIAFAAFNLLVLSRLMLGWAHRLVSDAKSDGKPAAVMRFRDRGFSWGAAIVEPAALRVHLSRSTSIELPWESITSVTVEKNWSRRPAEIVLTNSQDSTTFRMFLVRPFGFSALTGADVEDFAEMISTGMRSIAAR
jgi:hypothetical protein